MNQIKTKLLKTIWNNIHRADGLIAGFLTDDKGRHCAVGCTFGKKVYSNEHYYQISTKFTLMGLDESMGIIACENDNRRELTPQQLRIHMLKFIGKELMSRNDIEVGFKEKVEALS